ncbi:MAG: hypothetical protein QOD77_456 [Thermoplasmata archaeon]|nr:hypothetical protein [Thermoplasmata archaeon]
MLELTGWETYYVIVGAAAGALVGLQFIVLTLIADRPRLLAGDATAAFATPTIVHFCAVLVVSSLVCAPWESMPPLAFLWGAVGVAGIGYSVLVGARMRKQATYKPQLEDWVFHCVLPLAAYAALAASAPWALGHAREALFGVAAITLALLLVGIHNSWDAIVYSALFQAKAEEAKRG